MNTSVTSVIEFLRWLRRDLPLVYRQVAAQVPEVRQWQQVEDSGGVSGLGFDFSSVFSNIGKVLPKIVNVAKSVVPAATEIYAVKISTDAQRKIAAAQTRLIDAQAQLAASGQSPISTVQTRVTDSQGRPLTDAAGNYLSVPRVASFDLQSLMPYLLIGGGLLLFLTVTRR